jgi:hypothetical protein
LLATRPERSDEQDVSQTRQIANLATKQNTALEAQLKKAREENAELVQHDADIAAFYKSDADTQPSKDQGNVQAVREDANLAINTLGPGQIQPLNPATNESPASSRQPLNPPDQRVRP